jgi:hypothetical protein
MQTKYLPENLMNTNVSQMTILEHILRHMMLGSGEDSPASRQDLMACPYEHSNETSIRG